MANYNPQCKVCSSLPARAAVNAALLAGERPADVVRTYGEALGLSASSIYRHARAHLESNTFVPRWIDGESTVGDLVSDLGALRRSLLEQHRAAVERGADQIANRHAHEAHSISRTLLENAVSDDSIAASLSSYERVQKVLQQTALKRPEWLLEFAAVAREKHDTALAAEAEALTDRIRTHLATIKENTNV